MTCNVKEYPSQNSRTCGALGKKDINDVRLKKNSYIYA